MTHAPGPWVATGFRHLVVNDANGVTLALHPGSEVDEAEATAYLIAAAPDMLAALKNAEQWIGKMIADKAHLNSAAPGHCVRTLEQITHAITKAEGKEQPHGN